MRIFILCMMESGTLLSISLSAPCVVILSLTIIGGRPLWRKSSSTLSFLGVGVSSLTSWCTHVSDGRSIYILVSMVFKVFRFSFDLRQKCFRWNPGTRGPGGWVWVGVPQGYSLSILFFTHLRYAYYFVIFFSWLEHQKIEGQSRNNISCQSLWGLSKFSRASTNTHEIFMRGRHNLFLHTNSPELYTVYHLSERGVCISYRFEICLLFCHFLLLIRTSKNRRAVKKYYLCPTLYYLMF
jgi:hypothetical protein